MNFTNPPWPSNFQPRRWQGEAEPIIIKHLQTCVDPVLVRAITGAGKAALIGRICQRAVGQTVVATPSQLLVRQLRKTISEMVGGLKSVGAFYADRKDTQTDVIVTCMPSAQALSQRIKAPTLLIIDECHKSEGETIKNSINALSAAHVLGFTATPFRARAKETLSVFDRQIYEYSAEDALRDGVVVPWKIVPWTGAEVTTDEACLSMIASAKGPGIVNASTIQDADDFVIHLASNGIKAEAVHSGIKNVHQWLLRLKDGLIKCVVSVNMLAEGADFPWLMWLCLRRNIGSRVMFLQFIGRALRSYPGKTLATFYDPNDLFGLHRITYEAALGDDPKDVLEELIDLPIPELTERIQHEKEAVALQIYEMELRRLVVACDAAGMCPDRAITYKKDRNKSATPVQLAMIRSADLTHVPDSWQRFFALLIESCHKFKAGACSDFCCVLNSINSTKRFPPLDADGLITAVPGESVKAWPARWEQEVFI